MATYYWVPVAGDSNGTWDFSDASHWSTTSGGAGGAGVPTSADNVIFNAASGATNYVVSVDGGECLDFTSSITTVGRITFVNIFDGLDVYGSVNVTAQTIFDESVEDFEIFLYAPSGARTISTNNTRITALYIGSDFSSTASWTFSTGFTGRDVIHYIGNLNTNNQTITLTDPAASAGCAFSFDSLSNGYTLTLGSSTINIGASGANNGPSLLFSVDDNSTVSPGTSIINIGSASLVDSEVDFYGGGKTFRTLVMNSRSAIRIGGSNTFTVRLQATGNSPYAQFRIDANQIVNAGVFQVNGASLASRLLVSSNTSCSTATITLTGTATRTLTNVDFLDIALVFGSSVGGTSVGNFGRNSGITFTASTTRYLVLGGATKDFTSTTAWSTTSGGATSA